MVTKRTANHGFLRRVDGKSVNFTDGAAHSSSSGWLDKYFYRCHLMVKVSLVQMKLARASTLANGSSPVQSFGLREFTQLFLMRHCHSHLQGEFAGSAIHLPSTSNQGEHYRESHNKVASSHIIMTYAGNAPLFIHVTHCKLLPSSELIVVIINAVL